MKRCRHKRLAGRAWSRVTPRWYSYFHARADDPHSDALVCLACGHWLPLGPARDDERTAVELRAAELSDLARSHATPQESLGWEHCRRGADSAIGDDEYMAGWLGFAIHTHEED